MKSKTVAIIDGGGRGAVLAEKYLQSPSVQKVLVIPGNDLIKFKNKNAEIFPEIKTTDIENIKKICRAKKVNLVDVAQDDAVAAGVVDELEEEGFKVFGPAKMAGQLEWDKAFAREFMEKFKIPSPKYKICQSEKEGIQFIDSSKEAQWFVKASGLAAGKGAIFASSKEQAVSAIKEMKSFGQSGKTFLIEEYLVGEEFSAFATVDGNNFKILGYAQDHKRVYDGDLGPNTGGMGCTSTPLIIDEKIAQQTEAIFKKTVEGLVKMGRPYKGILYLGAMVVDGKVWVIEFNARWGDPEAQVIIPSLKSDFYQPSSNVIKGDLSKVKIDQENNYRIVVTVSARGYPEDYSKAKDRQIFGLEKLLKNPQIKIYGAGIKIKKNKFYVSGGRLFYVYSEGKDIESARSKVYNALSSVFIEGNNQHFRTDIGWRDLERQLT